MSATEAIELVIRIFAMVIAAGCVAGILGSAVEQLIGKRRTRKH